MKKKPKETVPRTWGGYEREVRKLEKEGLTTSDAQGVVDARLLRAGVTPASFARACEERRKPRE